MSHYAGTLGDKGTMTVDVLSEQPDHGLVVSISEQAESTRKAPPATCVVYGNTLVICDPNRTVNSEEYTLLRFLASNFINPLAVDSKQHWGIEQGPSDNHVTADYTILSNDKGVMRVDEARTIKQRGSGTLTTTVQTKIVYDFARLVPTSIDEYTQQRGENGIEGTSKTVYQTTLRLVSDSAAKN